MLYTLVNSDARATHRLGGLPLLQVSHSGHPVYRTDSVNQEPMSLITLISMLLKHRPLRPSEEALRPLLSSMKAVTQLPMLNWLQWMLTTFLIAGMRLFHTLLPPEILDHLALPRIPTRLGGNAWCTSI